MSLTDPMRWLVAVSLVVAGTSVAQTGLPAIAPTTAPAHSAGAPASGVSGGTAGSVGAAADERHDAVVRAVGGKVEVVADGSSLEQILGQIGRVTGMKITGNVADEPVYGTYGPANANEVLAALLDGTGSNMLLREATAVGPGELILTPRTGGVTPPDPNAPSPRQGYVEPNVPGSRNYQRPRESWMIPPAPGSPAYNGPPQQPANNQGQGGAAAQSPNPQQVYQQLQQLQQTQQTAPETQKMQR